MTAKNGNGGNLGFEDRLWKMADKMRGHMDAAEYKHVVLGLIFLKYISDAFQAKYEDLKARADTDYTDPEDRDEYAAANVFWVPPEARWETIQAQAPQPEIGKTIDDAMVAIERENESLKGVLPKNYSRPALDKTRLGELVKTVGDIDLQARESGVRDPLGRVYEYFLGKFAEKEGKGGGEFYTPQSIVQLLVKMIEPYKGRVYDPCCGSGGMFVQSEKFVEEHGGRLGDIAIYGQESNPTTWRLAKMNLAIRGIDADLAGEPADSFHNDLHKDLKSDYVLANPPFNDSDWGGERLKEELSNTLKDCQEISDHPDDPNHKIKIIPESCEKRLSDKQYIVYHSYRKPLLSYLLKLYPGYIYYRAHWPWQSPLYLQSQGWNQMNRLSHIQAPHIEGQPDTYPH